MRLKSVRVSLVASSCGLALLLSPLSLVRAEGAGSVEDGLRTLAGQIVQKSAAAERTTIAVLPFQNADGTCSVLSTHIVDELTLDLFDVPGSKLTLIERSQLQALIAELSIGESGLLNPTTTKELGKVSGVQALVLGSITIIGDVVRINARLVATDTGQAISAAAVSLPKTDAVTKLLAQPIAGGPGCGMFVGKGVGPGVATTQPPPTGKFSTGGLDFSVQGISRTQDKKAVNVVIGVVNTNEKPVKALFLGTQASLLDNMGNQAFATSATGIEVCKNATNWWESISGCWEKKDQLTILTPKVLQTVLIRFTAEGDKKDDATGIAGDMVSFSSRIGLQKADEKEPAAYSISIPNIALK
ncbi:CsgG/HfaB family protein [uncultured Thiodictyon sp.]|uniref:CsgG/HfaB family protein n=1 Tax=uncultured Thiodictyon sp. TaxID=1846217 RepID=UPI0025DA4977|nr:CsgG/HfaB family protein [uncultured Thiodictyon sp.]